MSFICSSCRACRVRRGRSGHGRRVPRRRPAAAYGRSDRHGLRGGADRCRPSGTRSRAPGCSRQRAGPGHGDVVSADITVARARDASRIKRSFGCCRWPRLDGVAGVGRALVDRMSGSSASRGRMREVLLSSLPQMTAAHALYREFGFVRAPSLITAPNPRRSLGFPPIELADS